MSAPETPASVFARYAGELAFPVTVHFSDGMIVTGSGLSKRELIAAMVMQGLAGAGQPWPCPGVELDRMAEIGLGAADALLARLADSASVQQEPKT